MNQDGRGRTLDCRFQTLGLGKVVISFIGAVSFERPGAPFEARLVRITERAFLIQLPSRAEMWFPKQAFFPAGKPGHLTLVHWARTMDDGKWSVLEENLLAAETRIKEASLAA